MKFVIRKLPMMIVMEEPQYSTNIQCYQAVCQRRTGRQQTTSRCLIRTYT